MDVSAHLPGRPRPVAGVPPLDAAGTARAWVLALVGGRPLERAADLDLAALATEGPVVCAALALALGSDQALTDLGSQGAVLVRLAGAREPSDAVAAAEALRLAAGATLQRADPEAAAAAADRLAHCCAALAASAGDAVRARRAEPATPAAPVEPEDLPVRAVAPAPVPDLTFGRGIAPGAPVPAAPLAPDPEERAALLLSTAPPPAAIIALELDGEPDGAVPEASEAQIVTADAGRWFLVMPADGARDVAERLAAELDASAGVAVRHGGEDPAGLVALADERLFAARAAGVPVT